MHQRTEFTDDRSDNTTPRVSYNDGGRAAAVRRASSDARTLDQTLTRCLLETQQQVRRLEATVRRLMPDASGDPSRTRRS